MVGDPNRDNVTDAMVEALRASGHDGQVIFRTVAAWANPKDAFNRTAQEHPLVELRIGSDRA